MPGLVVCERRSGEPLDVLEPLADLPLERHAVALRLPLPAGDSERLLERVELLPHLARDRFADPARELARVTNARHQRVGIEAIGQEIEGHVLGGEIDRPDERSPEVTLVHADIELEVPRNVDETRDRDATLDVACHPVQVAATRASI